MQDTLASPDDHLVFSSVIDVLFNRILAAYVNADARQRIKALGIDLSRKLDPAYPLRIVEAAVEVVAEDMADLSKSDAMRRIGEMQVEAFQETVLGRATMQLLRLLPRKRFLNRLTASFRRANNFTETRLVEVVPDQHYRVRVNDAGRYPESVQGILGRGLALNGHRSQVTVGEREGLAAWFDIRFE